MFVQISIVDKTEYSELECMPINTLVAITRYKDESCTIKHCTDSYALAIYNVDDDLYDTLFYNRLEYNSDIEKTLQQQAEQILIEYYIDNRLHNDTGYAIIFTIQDIKIMYSYINNKLHSDGRPAMIRIEKGIVRQELWCDNGKRHRYGGPSYICYDRFGNPCAKHYYVNNRLHREDGPAYIIYKQQYYYYHGDAYSKESYMKLILEKIDSTMLSYINTFDKNVSNIITNYVVE